MIRLGGEMKKSTTYVNVMVNTQDYVNLISLGFSQNPFNAQQTGLSRRIV
jgi:hypothetical protein